MREAALGVLLRLVHLGYEEGGGLFLIPWLTLPDQVAKVEEVLTEANPAGGLKVSAFFLI